VQFIAIYEAVEKLADKHANTGPALLAELRAFGAKARAEHEETLKPKQREAWKAKLREKWEAEDREEAPVITERHRREFIEKWCKAIRQSVMRGDLRAFDPSTLSPSVPADVKASYIHKVLTSDLNKWLETIGSAYRLEGEAAEVVPVTFLERARSYVTDAYRGLKGGGSEPKEMDIANEAARRMNQMKEKDTKGRERSYTGNYIRRHVMDKQGEIHAWEPPKD
jgi:hypothetical protein